MLKTMVALSGLVAVALSGGSAPGAAAAGVQVAATRLALVGGTLIDGISDRPRRNAVLLIRDGRIEQIGAVGELAVPSGYSEVNTDGQYVLPGLWDMHVHLLYAGHTNIQYWHQTYTSRYEREIMPVTARQLLMAGVTSVRDMGAPPDAIFAVEKRISSGTLEGPTIYAAGPQLTHMPPAWAQQYRWAVSGASDAAAKANDLLQRGADLLKVTDAESMTTEEIRAITAAARALGRIVSAHGRTDAEVRIGLDAGVDDFQHIGVAPDGALFPTDLIAAVRARTASGRPLYWTPTVGLPLRAAALRDDPESLEAPAHTAGLPALIAEDIRRAVKGFSPQQTSRDVIVAKARQLRDAGVEFLVGTDGGLTGAFHTESTWQEMDAWVRDLNLDPMETIRRATSLAARAAGAGHESGSLEAGKQADVIVVDGNPLRSMRALRNPSVVIKNGRRVR